MHILRVPSVRVVQQRGPHGLSGRDFPLSSPEGEKGRRESRCAIITYVGATGNRDGDVEVVVSRVKRVWLSRWLEGSSAINLLGMGARTCYSLRLRGSSFF